MDGFRSRGMVSPRFYFVRTDPFERGQSPQRPAATNPRNTSSLLRSHSSPSSSLLVFPATSRCALNIAHAKFGRFFDLLGDAVPTRLQGCPQPSAIPLRFILCRPGDPPPLQLLPPALRQRGRRQGGACLQLKGGLGFSERRYFANGLS